jgi:ureidoglycolate amidohydrolase
VQVSVREEQLAKELATLAGFSDAPVPAVTRVVFTPTDLRARAYVRGLCEEAGLTIREDAIGNMFARWPGSVPELAPIGTGSHIDAIPNAGAYDGTVGVLGGLEAIRALQRSGFQPRRSLELLLFTSEEPTRFGIGCLGSRLLAGTLAPDALAKLRDPDGLTVDQARSSARFQGPLETVQLPAGYYDSFVELHIEQGPLLERQGIPIGIVTNIAAPATVQISIEGEGGHAGAVLMPDRRDAFLGACEIALIVELAAKSTGSRDTVATVGVCDIFPGAVNSIPSRARLLVDVRDIDPLRRDRVLDAIRLGAQHTAASRNLTVNCETLNQDLPAQSDPRAIEAIQESCEEHGITPLHMISRAYHDSLFMSRVNPVAMIFIPCRGGVSHRPDEFASPTDIARGVQVLAGALARLAG